LSQMSDMFCDFFFFGKERIYFKDNCSKQEMFLRLILF